MLRKQISRAQLNYSKKWSKNETGDFIYLQKRNNIVMTKQ